MIARRHRRASIPDLPDTLSAAPEVVINRPD
jgi:hypothetical protein